MSAGDDDNIDLERGQRVRDLIEDRHTTQAAVARALKVADRSVKRWVDGETISPENAQRLAIFLQSTPAYIQYGLGNRDSIGDLNKLGQIEAKLDAVLGLLISEKGGQVQGIVSEAGAQLLETIESQTRQAPDESGTPPEDAQRKPA